MHKTSAETNLSSLTKLELNKLCEDVLSDNQAALELAVSFFVLETRGIWHGRARAKLARHLKHIELSASVQRRIVDIIISRFVAGNFSEQFKDQLRLGLHLAPERLLSAARGCTTAKVPHVKRYADWLLLHTAFEKNVSVPRSTTSLGWLGRLSVGACQSRQAVCSY